MSCVVLAERHHGLAEGVRGLLETMFGTIVMVADKGSLLDVASRLQPDVAVVDLSLGHDGGLDWLRSVRQHCPALKVVALSVHDEPAVRRAAMDAGADDFVLTGARGHEERSLDRDLSRIFSGAPSRLPCRDGGGPGTGPPAQAVGAPEGRPIDQGMQSHK